MVSDYKGKGWELPLCIKKTWVTSEGFLGQPFSGPDIDLWNELLASYTHMYSDTGALEMVCAGGCRLV